MSSSLPDPPEPDPIEFVKPAMVEQPIEQPEATPVLNYSTVTPSALVELASFGTAWEAHLAAGKVQAGGVPCSVGNEHFNATVPFLAGGARIYVREADKDQALTILKAKPPAEAGDDEDDDWAELKCPGCGSTDLHVAPIPGWFLVPSLILLGIPLLLAPNRLKCAGCGRVFAHHHAVQD